MKPKKSLGLKTQFEFARAKKALGQNFLKSNLALNKIIEAGEISQEDLILEIGPGRGVLTEKLLEKASTVVAVEKDRELFDFLSEKFAEEIKEGKLILIEGDILKFDISEALQSYTGKNFSQVLGSPSLAQPDRSKTFSPFRFKVIANIPYNITGAILKKFLTKKNQPESMVLMVQHEVAKRIIANDGKESILSISVKAYGEPKLVMKVPARYFSPAPKVDSAVISIKNISRKLFSAKGGSASGGEDNSVNEEKFWEIVRTGFAHKRKKLSGNLKNLCTKATLEKFKDKRAENLTLSDWIFLTREQG